MFSTIMDHGTTQNRSRASWCVTNTDTQTTTPLRRCRLNLSRRLSARHTTRTRGVTHDEQHHGPATMPTAHSLRRRANTRGRVRGGIFFSGRRRRCLVGGAFRTFRNYPEYLMMMMMMMMMMN